MTKFDLQKKCLNSRKKHCKIMTIEDDEENLQDNEKKKMKEFSHSMNVCWLFVCYFSSDIF